MPVDDEEVVVVPDAAAAAAAAAKAGSLLVVLVMIIGAYPGAETVPPETIETEAAGAVEVVDVV